MNKTGVQLVYLFWMCSMVYCVAADTDNVISEEEKTITLPWPLKDTGHVFRFWCKGRFTRTPADGEFLFKQYLSTDPVDKSNRTDMKVNTDFDLVIGTTQLVDASTYTAVFQPGIGSSSFNYASLVIYKTPTLTFTGLDKNAYNESDPVDVSCKVRDGYPQMHLDNFNINWEGRDFNDKDNTTGSTDKYYSYKIEKQLNLTANDGNVNVTCSVYLTVEGLMLAESRIFTVSYGPQSNPKLNVSEKNPHRFDNVTFACDYSNIKADPPELSMKWQFNGTDLGGSDTTLVITRVKDEEHSGTYSCIIYNTVGTRKSDVTLTVSDKYGPQNPPTLRIYPQSTYQYENVTFDCMVDDVDANPDVSLMRWIRKSDDLPYTELNTTRQVMHGDRGLYRCEVGNYIDLNMTSGPVYLDVSKKYRPQGTLESTVTDETPRLFDSVNFTCDDSHMNANPEIHILEWSQNGEIIVSWNDQRFMTIDHVHKTHNGTYLCYVTNEVGFVESMPVVLNINPQYAPQEAPTLHIDHPDTAQFEDVTFECAIGNVHANPEVTLVNWFRNTELLVDWPNNNFPVKMTVNQSDTGYYSCSLGNTIGYSSYSPTRHLNVSDQYRPDRAPILDVDNKNPFSWDNVTLTCNESQVCAKPAVSSVVWMVNGTESDWSGIMHTIDDVQVSDSGDYSCQVVNSIGPSIAATVINLDVSAFYAPRGAVKMQVTGSVHKNHAKLGNKVVFTCNIDRMKANPADVNVTWMQGKAILTDWPTIEYEHTISASKDDNGTYTCIVNNTIGILTSNGEEFTTSENFPPTVEPTLQSKGGTLTEGGAFEFDCEIDDKEASPSPYVVWYKNGEKIDWKDKKVKLLVKVEDSGNYTCCAKNFMAISPYSDAVILQVEGKPEGSSPLPIILGVIGAVVLIAVIIVAVIVVKKRRTPKPGSGNTRRDDTDYNPPGVENQGADYAEIGLAAVGGGKPAPSPRKTRQPDVLPEGNTYENQRADLPDYAEVNKQPKGGATSTDGNDIPTYAEVNKPQGDIAEYAEVKKPPISKKPTVKAPPGTEGMIYAEGLWDGGKRQPVKTHQAPPKPAPAPKKQVEEPTEYAQIDYTKSTNNKPSANF